MQAAWQFYALWVGLGACMAACLYEPCFDFLTRTRGTAARKAITERKRVDSFTRDGLALINKARTAVSAVRATEAARDGWLSDQADLDFSADLTFISEALLQARRIEKVVERSKKIPDPSAEDVAMLRDA